MDSGEGGGDGGGGEERDTALSPWALPPPLLTSAVIPEEGSSSHTSAGAPAKEPLTPPPWEEWGEGEGEGAEGSHAGEETRGGGAAMKDRGGLVQGSGGCEQQGAEEPDRVGHLSGPQVEHTGEGGPVAHSSRGGDEEEENGEEVAVSNQSQTKSKCSLLPQQSQHSSSSSTAMASSRASPLPPPASPKHFSRQSSPPSSDTEVRDGKGDLGWTSGLPQSFKSQESTLGLSPVGPDDDDDDDVEGDGVKAPEPNHDQREREARDGEQDAVLRNLSQDLSPGSLANHMTIMHSRNSCKTLKCPKCNWHYKSQHTLQMHMREKHPETGGQCVCGGDGKCACGGASRGACGFCSSGKPHPRLARGETYACGYKPYRCEACDYATSSKGNLSIHMQSDKHLNNVQGGALAHSAPGGQEEQAFKLALLPVHPANTQPPRPTLTTAAPPQQQPLSPTTTATLAPQSGPPGKRWRCDVCDYETGIARNLRIHTTSEKHTHNLLRLQRGYYLSHCRSLGPPLKHMQNAGAELPLNLRLTAQQLPEPPMGLGSTLTPSPSPSPSPPPAPSLSPAAAPLSLGSFQCLVCSSFSSDSLEAVEQHAGAPRSLPQADWCTLVAGGCHCRLCGYTTPLRANFSLHCQTDRHRTRYQLAAHLQEGGERGQEAVAALIAKGNPVQLRCNLCDYPTVSVEKLRGHAHGSHHETSVRVYRFLQQYEDEVGRGSWMFHCLVCNHSSSSKLQLLKHSQTQTHQQREGLLQLQPMGGEELAAIFTIRKSPDGVMGELSEDIGAASEAAIGPLEQTKDPCNFGVEQNSKDTDFFKDTLAEEREKKKPLKRSSPECEETESPISPKRPRTHQQNENQQTVQCPLCQVQIPYTHLRQHLTYLHSVAQDCVDKLISTVSTPMEPAEADVNAEYQTYSDSTDFSHKNGSCIDETNVNVSNTDSPTIVESHKNKDSSVENTEEGDAAAPKDVAALLTPPLEEPASQPSSGRPPPQSPTRLTSSSPPGDPPSSSDRHGYRFRCSRCSLAFPTREKLQLHWQYHAMRAATECPLCSRRCRSQEALQRHMQNTHLQLEASAQSTLLLLPPAGQTQTEQSASSVQQDISLSPREGQEAGEGDDDDDDNDDLEDEALEVEGKDERRDEGTSAEKDPAAEADVGEEDLLDVERGRREDVGSDPGPSLQLRKGTNPTLDRFLDPSRPYKCTVCSESFTQKTILLVHYNSVSHLHRARRALQDSGPGLATPETPRGPDPRPYRCRLCGVGYSQSSTLDIHLRSVLHQTRARAAQNTASQTPAAGSTAPGQTPATTAEETSKSLPLPKRPELVSSPPSSSSIVSSSPVADAKSDIQQAKKRVAELLASRNQLMLMQQQQLAQAQAQLQQHTALLQSQLFNPALLQHLPLGPESLLKQHFSLAPDNFLSLQQQLLLPFYLSGEMKLNPELMLKSPELIQTSAASFASTEQLREYLTEPAPPRREKESQKHSSDSTVAQQNVQCEAKVGAGCSGSLVDRADMENHSTDDVEKTKDTAACGVKTEKHTEENKQADCTSGNRPEPEFPPPRVPYAAVNGEPLRALLQSYGYEMALQYTQSRHRSQLKIATHITPEGQGNSGVNYKEVSSEQTREEYRQLGGVNVEGCGRENRQKESGNEESKCLVEERSKQEELPKGTKACCRGGEKCRDCGKLFSDALVLKSHQEYIHRLLFPTAVLERFSREYRSQYDRLYPLTHLTADEALPASAPAAAQSSELEAPASEAARPLAKTPPPTPDSSASDTAKMPAPTANPTPSPATPSPPPPSPEPPKEEGSVGNPNPALPLPNLPMLPLSMPQLSLPPLPLAKLPLPPIPFSMELPMLPSVVMQSVALQSQPWLDSSMTSDLAKLYQQQLSPALLGQQPKLSTALLAQQQQQQQQQQLSPALLGQPPQQLSPVLQQRQGSPAPAEQGRRARTRISDEQLSVLRCHFDISTLPSDEEINKMAARCGLPHKVIKHWFRNTLFKERQRDKDSPYNFNNPPTTSLDEVRGGAAPVHALTEPPSSLSPGLPSNHSPHPPKGDSSPRGDAGRGRRSSRTRFTEKQLETLQGVFETTPYPREEEYDKLSAMLALPNRVIVVWFQNARQRARKHQERGTEDGAEGKTQADGGQRQRGGGGGGGLKSGDGDQEEDCGDGPGNQQNENSMDFTYEYYTHPDSPEVDSPPPQPAKAELSAVCKKQDDDDDACLTQAEKSPPSVHTQSGSPESHIKSQTKETVNAAQKTTMPRLKAEITASRPQTNCSSSHKTPSRSYPGHASSPPSIPAMEKPAHTPHNLPPAPECETGIPRLPDPTLGISPETQPQNLLQQHQTLTQFQCSLCPMSLPSLQLWQDHQARHLLAAQSQVQLLHTGFTDCSMPYMMVHPNHTLIASQLLSSAMSQMHPSPGHPIMAHMNGLHSKHPLSGLPQTSLSSSAMKQSSKVTAEAGCGAPGGGREVEEEHRRDKRQRTTITPEQLEVLYQRYSMDSNPTRGVLESIARDVGLKRRVVQVWFQNTRARERKGQFRSTGPGASFSLGLNHLRCPFCRALFKVKSALDAHMRSRHWAEAERAGYNLSMAPGGPLGSMAASSLLERAGPSASSASSPTPGSLFCIKELHARPPLTLDCSSTELTNPDEDYEEDDEEEEYVCEEGSSVAEQGSFSPEGSVGPGAEWGEMHTQRQQQQQRQRTQMSHFQVLQLRDFYRSHRTPNRQECEALGRDLGLPHRVVQVWFQNARAKEKRARSAGPDSAEREQAELTAVAGERDRA